jgi:hypothetical protein
MDGFHTFQAWLLMGAWLAAFLLGEELRAGYRQQTARIVVCEGD